MHKNLNILLEKPVKNLHYFFVKNRLYWLSAALLFFLTKKLNPKASLRILCLSKDGFNDDILTISEKFKNVCFLVFPKDYLLDYIRVNIPIPHRANQTGEETWLNPPSLEEIKKQIKSGTNVMDPIGNIVDATYYEILEGTKERDAIFNSILSFFPYFYSFLKFRIIMSGNFVYRAQQELFRVSKITNIPTLILYKEGMFRKSDNKTNKNFYKGKFFFADKILFYNSTIEKTMLEANIPNLTKDVSQVVGIPRLDSYLADNSKPNSSKKITLFAFESSEKSRIFFSNLKKSAKFVEFCQSFHKYFVDLAFNYPSYEIIIKFKKEKFLIDFLKNQYNSGADNFPKNLKLTSEGKSLDLIKESKFVGGFLSTTLLESIALRKPIICPDMSLFLPNKEINSLVNYKDTVNIVSAYKDLDEFLNGSRNLKCPDSVTRRKILSDAFYALDSKSSERTLIQIYKLLKSFSYKKKQHNKV